MANLGGPGDVVNVKPGYAYNYLIPTNKAMPKTEENLRRIESEKAELAALEARLKSDAEAIRETHKDLLLEFDMKSGNEGVLYGSVTPQDVAEALEERGLEVDRKKLIFPTAIKRLGVYDVMLRLHPEVDLDVKVLVDDSTGIIPDEIKEELQAARAAARGESAPAAEETAEAAPAETPEETPAEEPADETAEAAAETTEEVAKADAPEEVEAPAEEAEEEKSE